LARGGLEQGASLENGEIAGCPLHQATNWNQWRSRDLLTPECFFFKKLFLKKEQREFEDDY
jgi:hypothetical protein